MKRSKDSENESTGRDLKRPDYSVVNAEIARSWKRRKAELQGVEKEQKHREASAVQATMEAAKKAEHQRTLDEKGRNHDKRQQQSRSR